MEPRPADVLAAASRLSGKVVRTPLVRSAWLSSATGGDVWLKLENRQLEGSFKTRGAFNHLLTRTSPEAGVVAASGGNHGAAVAYATRKGFTVHLVPAPPVAMKLQAYADNFR